MNTTTGFLLFRTTFTIVFHSSLSHSRTLASPAIGLRFSSAAHLWTGSFPLLPHIVSRVLFQVHNHSGSCAGQEFPSMTMWHAAASPSPGSDFPRAQCRSSPRSTSPCYHAPSCEILSCATNPVSLHHHICCTCTVCLSCAPWGQKPDTL